MKRWIIGVAGTVVGLLVLACGLGAAYEGHARAQVRAQFPPPGKLVDVGGRRIQLDCRGSGTPVVVFEAGRDMNGSLSWYRVHDDVARLTRACAYSRAGILWSDPTPGPHTAKAEAFDLHAALERAGEQPPFVLVGHSAGVINAMVYTKYFGPQVAGLVFVDGSHPDMFSRLRPVLGDRLPHADWTSRLLARLAWTGLGRLTWPKPEPGAPQILQTVAAYAPVSFPAAIAEVEADPESFTEAGTFRQLGSRPLYVLTAQVTLPGYGEPFLKVWHALHDEQATWSSVSEQELVSSPHYIQWEKPDRVVAAVRWVVDRVRKVSPERARGQTHVPVSRPP